MPIRLNLLAEAQAAEEMRRRDPVKRAAWMGGFLVAMMLAWSLWIQFKVILARQELAGVEANAAAKKTEHQAVQEAHARLNENTNKLGQLRMLAASRLLSGTLLNTFQQSVMDEVNLTRLKIEQSYVQMEEVKPKTNGNRVIPGKAPTVTESILLTVEARDFSDGGYTKFKEKLSGHPYFQNVLGKTNEVTLKNLSRPTSSADGGSYVDFILEIRYPELTR
jgi:hypothetical protein